MIIRIWQTRFDPTRLTELHELANTTSAILDAGFLRGEQTTELFDVTFPTSTDTSRPGAWDRSAHQRPLG